MRKRGRFGSLLCATIAGVTVALIGAAGLGAQSQSTQPENTPARPVTYLWQGRIEVENNYNGQAGEHRWTAQYQVKFLEEQTSERHSYIDSFEVYEIVPLELKYTIHARQDWDREGVGRGADGQILTGPVRMHGQATGIISADQMKGYQFLSGDIGAIEAPADSASTNQRAFASDTEYSEFWNNHRTSPGWYRLDISFGDGDFGEQRARYNGINRSGEQPIGDDPDLDFVSSVPSFMPAGTNVIGRLDTPDQTDVRGEISLRYRDDDPEHVKVKWSFVRCREGVPCPSPPSTDCPDPRFVYAGTRDGRIRSEPSSNSSVVGSPANGTRLRYTRTQQVHGQTWYYVVPPGRPPGWFSGEQASCTRPEARPPTRRIIPIEDIDKYSGRAALASAGRG